MFSSIDLFTVAACGASDNDGLVVSIVSSGKITSSFTFDGVAEVTVGELLGEDIGDDDGDNEGNDDGTEDIGDIEGLVLLTFFNSSLSCKFIFLINCAFLLFDISASSASSNIGSYLQLNEPFIFRQVPVIALLPPIDRGSRSHS